MTGWRCTVLALDVPLLGGERHLVLCRARVA